MSVNEPALNFTTEQLAWFQELVGTLPPEKELVESFRQSIIAGVTPRTNRGRAQELAEKCRQTFRDMSYAEIRDMYYEAQNASMHLFLYGNMSNYKSEEDLTDDRHTRK